MAIMVAGGLTFAVPGVTPAAAQSSNANLIVSAENSVFENYFAGAQVIEVIVNDDDIKDTNEAKGEPDVTVNGADLRMVQAVDGLWYGYFASRTHVNTADQTVPVGNAGSGLDFGIYCDDTADDSGEVRASLGVSVSDATGYTLDAADCSGGAATELLNVLREAKDVNQAAPGTDAIGQIGLASIDVWPFIQLYDFNPTGNVDVQYNKGGNPQKVSLTFDTVDDYAKLELDRTTYPLSAQVHATITDTWLNIDPTDEDSWTFDTTTGAPFYQVFTENGESGGAAVSIVDQLGALMCDTNCKLLLETNAQDIKFPNDTLRHVVTLQDNEDSIIVGTAPQDPASFGIDDGNGVAVVASTDAAPTLLGVGTVPVTITEQGPNTGVFGTYDEQDASSIIITENAARGTSATIDYNDSATTILAGFDFATIDIKPTKDVWASGEEIPITIKDGDQNKNSRADEDLIVSDPSATLIPALRTGDPFTLATGTDGVRVLALGTGVTLETTSTHVEGSTAATRVVTTTTTGEGETAETTTATDGDFTEIQDFSDRAMVSFARIAAAAESASTLEDVQYLIVDLGTNATTLESRLLAVDTGDPTPSTEDDPENVLPGTASVSHNFFNYDVRSFNASLGDVQAYLTSNPTDGASILDDDGTVHADTIVDTSAAIRLVTNGDPKDYVPVTNVVSSISALDDGASIGLIFDFGTGSTTVKPNEVYPIVADFFSFGFTDDGVESSERTANQIIRIEAEETGDNTGIFAGSLEYVMVNQINIQDESTFAGILPIDDEPSFIVIEDLTDEDSPRVSYNDLGNDGIVTPVSDQQEAPSHSGIVELDAPSYKVADTVTITVTDADLNTDSDTLEIYTTFRNLADPTNRNNDQVGVDHSDGYVYSFGSLGRLLDVTFDDLKWTNMYTAVQCNPGDIDGLASTGFTLKETGTGTGIFKGNFQIPEQWCRPGQDSARASPETTTGLDIEANYVDFRDKSGEIIEVGASAGVRATTGSVSLDRTVYPVPFGGVADFSDHDATPAIFPLHSSARANLPTGSADGFLPAGDLTVHIRVNDPDFDVSASGADSMKVPVNATTTSPVEISVQRGSSTVILGYAGSNQPANTDGKIIVADGVTGARTDSFENPSDMPHNHINNVREFGPISEVAPSAGIFELDLPIRFTDGPASASCPENILYESDDSRTAAGPAETRFSIGDRSDRSFCILQGDILQVEYTDPTDASGDSNTVTDSATFDLRNGVLQSDKTIYVIGSDMILTLIEPDFDLDNDAAETYDLDLIEWDSSDADISMGDLGNRLDAQGRVQIDNAGAFDPEPTDLRETGDSTGIFQVVIEIPKELNNDRLERGEEIQLEYTDWGPSGSDYVGDEDEDINLYVYTSNFGSSVALDQKVYSWTDKVYITVTAPDHNFDSDLVDEIGTTTDDPVRVSTRSGTLDQYKLVETGTDTGIFTGEVILTGFAHDADGDTTTGDDNGNDVTTQRARGNGPTSGFLPASDDDGITVSFEYSEDETAIGTALVRWNIGEVQWLESSYPAAGAGVVRVIDADMNLNPEAVDNFNVEVTSTTDQSGIQLTVTETNTATGIFEGTVDFSLTQSSSGHRLRIEEGDAVIATYNDNTLPAPYTTANELEVVATSQIGTIVPPLERAPAKNLRVVDAFGNTLDSVSVDQQVQLTAELTNGQDREQKFAYLIQVQDANGVTVSLAWITGSLTSAQTLNPSQSWTPTTAGTYTATAFVWESVDNPTALSPPATTSITVS